jgi:hypothetical protein
MGFALFHYLVGAGLSDFQIQCLTVDQLITFQQSQGKSIVTFHDLTIDKWIYLPNGFSYFDSWSE